MNQLLMETIACDVVKWIHHTTTCIGEVYSECRRMSARIMIPDKGSFSATEANWDSPYDPNVDSKMEQK